MINAPEPIWVLGHRNPDTDAIASACGYGWLLAKTFPNAGYRPGRVGPVNAQTAFALGRFGMEAPPLVSDVRRRVSDVMELLPYLTEGQTILEACQSIAQTRRPAPLLDENMRPIGLLTGAGLFGNLVDALSSASVLALAKEFDSPARGAIDDNVTTPLNQTEPISDVMGQVLRSEQDDFLVIDDDGRYVGLCRKSALLYPSRRRVVMVDHNELAQAVPGLEEAEVVEVLDHHRLSSPATSVPIRFYIDPVGSCSTLVTERAQELKQKFPPEIAGLLLSGILSDTLIFRSPTCTPRDREAAFTLARWARLKPNLDTDDDVMAAIQEFGGELLASGGGLGTRLAQDIVNTDVKFYEESGVKIGISQVEVTHFSELAGRLADLIDALQLQLEAEFCVMAILMVTDVVRGNSRLVAVGQPRLVASLPYIRLEDDTFDAPGVVSRKKQLLPPILAVLAENA